MGITNKDILKTVAMDVPNMKEQLESKASKDDVARLSSGTPKIVNSIAEMIDNTKNYVLSTDKYVYQYNGTSFVKSSILYVGVGFDKMPIENIEEYGVLSNNIFDKTKCEDAYIQENTGVLVPTTNGVYTSDFIPIEFNQEIIIKRTWYYGFYGADKTPITGVKLIKDNTIVKNTFANAKYIRFSCYNGECSKDVNQANYGNVLKPYDKYKKGISEDVLGLDTKYLQQQIDELKNIPSQDFICNLPNTIYTVKGKKMCIYFDNFLSHNANDYFLDISCLKGKHFADRWEYTPATTETFNLEVQLFDKNFNRAFLKAITINVVNNISPVVNKKALFMGDSIIDAGNVTQSILDKFTSDNNATITLLGNRGNGINKHEGVSGFSANHFRGSSSPFYNPTTKDFDLAYYKTQNSISDIDFVVINLGTNDVSALEGEANVKYVIDSTVIPNFQFIINNLLSNMTGKVILHLTIPPHGSQDIIGSTYSANRVKWRMERNVLLLGQKLIELYKDNPRVFISATNSAINRLTGFSDAVHPNNDGASDIADRDYSIMKFLINS